MPTRGKSAMPCWAREVVVWVQPALRDLAARADGVDRVLPLHDGTVEADFDVDVEIMELPHIFRSTLADLPARVPYIHTEPSLPLVRSGCHVGVVWRAGDWDAKRSVPLPLLAALGRVPGVTLHALQRGRALSEWRPEFGPVSGSDDANAAARVMRLGCCDHGAAIAFFGAELADAGDAH